LRVAAADRIKVLHVITGLNVGGAENALCKLMEHIDKEQFENTVVSLLPEGPMAARVRDAGVPVYSVNLRKSLSAALAFFRLFSLIKKLKPNIVQTWMYHADLIGGLTGKIIGIPVVWNIRHSNLDPSLNKKATLQVVKLCARLSRMIPAKIVCCAQKALDVHAEAGYEKGKMLVIPNGFDTDIFHPDGESRAAVREELGIGDDTLLLGMAGRFDPQKDHRNFFDAARIVASKNVDACFVLCGDGVDWENEPLVEMIDPAIRDRVYLLGRRVDMPRIYAALDVFVLSSAGEAFPNVVGEAMACGVPCVVTNVGDAALIVGDTGIVVPPGDSKVLASGILKLLGTHADERVKLGRLARERIRENYDVRYMARMYEDLYLGMC